MLTPVIREKTVFQNPDTEIDLRGKVFSFGYEHTNAGRYPLVVRGNEKNVRIIGGKVLGEQFPFAEWRGMKSNLDGNALTVDAATGCRVIEGFRCENVMDGVSVLGGNYVMKNCSAANVLDDYMEIDSLPESGHHDGDTVDGCLVYVSARPGGKKILDKPPVNLKITNALVRCQRVANSTEPNGWGIAGLFKGAALANGESTLNLTIEDSVFCFDFNSNSRLFAGIPLHAQCKNCLIIWRGEGEYQGSYPSGVEFTTDRTLYPRLLAERWNRPVIMPAMTIPPKI